MLGASFFGGLFGWFMIFLTHLAFRRRFEKTDGCGCRCALRRAAPGLRSLGCWRLLGVSDFDVVDSGNEDHDLGGIALAGIHHSVLFSVGAPGSRTSRRRRGKPDELEEIAMDELLKWREEFPILERTTYLISNSLGAMPRAVYKRMNDYADAWAHRGVRAWEEGWWDMAVTAGDKVGALIGAGPGEISLHQNVTLTQAIISSCFDFSGPRNKVVLVDFEFPSIVYFYMEQRRRGARVEMLKSEDGIHAPLEQSSCRD